jgi:uncharacterized membrane protein (UPF0127 family)
VVWLDSGGRVVDTLLAKPWQTRYAPRWPAKYILEGAPGLLKTLVFGMEICFHPSL